MKIVDFVAEERRIRCKIADIGAKTLSELVAEERRIRCKIAAFQHKSNKYYPDSYLRAGDEYYSELVKKHDIAKNMVTTKVFKLFDCFLSNRGNNNA